MIDNIERTEALMEMMRAVLPLSAELSTRMLDASREESTEPELPRRCAVTAVNYAGDEGGIVCTPDFVPGEMSKVRITSITHLDFDRGSPLSREIWAYRKHRIKRLRKLGVGPF